MKKLILVSIKFSSLTFLIKFIFENKLIMLYNKIKMVGSTLMIRDMEELLNQVNDPEIKEYLREALNCYNSHSYKACVIMSVISGVYDLHSKIKKMAKSDIKFRELDTKVENKKENLEPYEKFLIEQCGTDDIDMLNSNEVKELIRCLDTRNDCAHPSNFLCSPEKARDVYSSIIDIICSKKSLFGCNMIKLVIEELNDKTFFPSFDDNRVKSIVLSKLNLFHEKAKYYFLKTLTNALINSDNDCFRENSVYFIAFSEYCGFKDFQDILENLLKDENEKYLVEILSKNNKILNYFDDITVERIIAKFGNNLKSPKLNNLEYWIKILLSERIQEKFFMVNLINVLFSDLENKTLIKECVNLMLINKDCREYFKEILVSSILKNKEKIILGNMDDGAIIDLIKNVNTKEMFEFWINTILKKFNETNDFYIQNSIISNSFLKIPEEVWFELIDNDLKNRLLKFIVQFGASNIRYCSSSANDLALNLHIKYPKLTKYFVELFDNNDFDEFNKTEYQDLIKTYKTSIQN